MRRGVCRAVVPSGTCRETHDIRDATIPTPSSHALDDLLKTGPTGTNVMDVNVLLAGLKRLREAFIG